jgi:hypothetical protein
MRIDNDCAGCDLNEPDRGYGCFYFDVWWRRHEHAVSAACEKRNVFG